MKRRNKGEKPNLTTELIGIAIPCLVAAAAVRDWFFNWGTTPDEEFDFLPGDELAERITSTRAVTINAPVEEVWKWLTVRLASKRVYGDGPLLRVLAIEPYRYLVLERWGAFILRRIDDHTTRMIFRSHAEERSLLRRFADFLFFDPVHFMMERRMMLGIKERAEKRVVYGSETIAGGMDEHSETGSLSNQFSTSCRRTTSPTASAGGAISAAAT
ncbi:MAG: hypothetical protein ACXW2Q_08970 [Thermoanaerobaculia bacterium]